MHKDCCIHGIGNDIIEIDRIREAIANHPNTFVQKLFTEKEQKYSNLFKDPAPRYAARFAAKEAVVKALGTGFDNSINWKEIEILNDPNGKPYIQLSKELEKRFSSPKLLLSMSHSHAFATAVVIWTS
jgi:holo-[acyl-carrier protein] synthase